MRGFRRACTGTIKYTFPETRPVSNYTWMRCCIKQGSTEIIKELEDLTVDTESNTVTCPLTAEETVKFKYGHLYHQLRFGYAGTSDSSEIFKELVADVLDDEVIE